MAATPETKLKKKCQEYLDDLGTECWHFKVLGGPGQKAGVPDIVGCINGLFFAIELKIKPNKPSAKQLHEIRQIQNAEGNAVVCYTYEEFVVYMEGLQRWSNEQ
jgi:hypothetical protein